MNTRRSHLILYICQTLFKSDIFYVLNVTNAIFINKKVKMKLMRLTESDLHWIVKESVRRLIKESQGNPVLDEIAYAIQEQYGERIEAEEGEHEIQVSLDQYEACVSYWCSFDETVPGTRSMDRDVPDSYSQYDISVDVTGIVLYDEDGTDYEINDDGTVEKVLNKLVY